MEHVLVSSPRSRTAFLDDLTRAYQADFRGWDFSRIAETKLDLNPVPWDYQGTITALFGTAETLLDVGTGGGEFLDSLPHLPPRVFATEGYPPNLTVARERLAPRGVDVRPVENDQLPFDEETFDLVINRHESFSALELERVLRPSARFVTQQVGGMNDFNLNATLGAPPPHFYPWCLARAVEQLEQAGLEIVEMRESIGMTRFTDVRALVYYLKCIPWQVDDFSVEAYADRLGFIDDLVRRQGYFDSLNHRFFVVARKQG